MSSETGKDTLVPATLIVPPPPGSAPIWKLSMELFLTVAEYLDSATCLTFSQTCHTLRELSKQRSIYWRSARFAHGHLPRVAAMSSFTGEELRVAAIKSTNLEWKWEDKLPRLVRRIAIPYARWSSKNLIPSGSRWLFQYGMQDDRPKARVYDLVENEFVKVYDEVTKGFTEAFSIEKADTIQLIIGESLAPNQVLIAAQLNAWGGESIVAVYLANFSQDGECGMHVSFESKRLARTRSLLKHCCLQDGLLGITTNGEATIEQWSTPSTKRRLDIQPFWFPCGVQVARDRLLLLESDHPRTPKSWHISIFDISSVRKGEPTPLDNNGNPIQLFRTDFFPLLAKPVDPFYAPFWEDRVGEPGLHLGFKVLFTAGDALCHFDFHLDTELDESGSIQERLTLQTSSVLGRTLDERPVGLTTGFYALGPRASRIIWVGKQGEVRIRSDWTDDLTEDGASYSRVLDLRCRPQTTPTILAFDEQLGILLLNDTHDHHALFWFV